LVFSRHFLVLAAFAALMAWLGHSSAAPNLVTDFALYGSLHAAALVIAQSGRRLDWRDGLFIAVSGAFSAGVSEASLRVWPLAAMLPEPLGRYALLALSAATGALVYGTWIRLRGIVPLNPLSVGKIAIGCALAAVVGLATIKAAGSHGAWWIAVLWWYAFSFGLWAVR
jgi:hypothetical protein